MREPTKKHHTNNHYSFQWKGERYAIPLEDINQYKLSKKPEEKETYTLGEMSDSLYSKYTKPGVMLLGLRTKEGLTQLDLAIKLHTTQSNISAMENGRRPIGKNFARKLEKLFKVDYRRFL